MMINVACVETVCCCVSGTSLTVGRAYIRQPHVSVYPDWLPASVESVTRKVCPDSVKN
jgi:hypothetical protein